MTLAPQGVTIRAKRRADESPFFERRTVIAGVARRMRLHRHAVPDATGGVVALVQPGVIGTLEACRGDWCEVEADRYDAWLPRDQIWGVYPFEFSE